MSEDKKKLSRKERSLANLFTSEHIALGRVGSHMYGTNHAESDEDFMCIIADSDYRNCGMGNMRPFHAIFKDKDKKEMDYNFIPLRTFLADLDSGNPASLEFLWSRDLIESSELMKSLQRGFRPSYAKASSSARGIASFMFLQDSESMKSRRHALRLMSNLRDLRDNGFYNPRLSPEAIERFTNIALMDEGDFLRELSILDPSGSILQDIEEGR